MSTRFHVPGLDASRPQPALLLHSDPAEVMGLLGECPGLCWKTASDGEQVREVLRGYEPVVVFSMKHSGFPGDQHRAAIEAPSVRWFHVGGSGVDHLAGAESHGVTVTTCAGVLAPFLAERAVAALLHLSTCLHGTERSTRERRWEPLRFMSLQGKTALIVGAGRAGTELALRLRPFGMHLVGVRASGEPHPAFDEMHRPEALAGLLPRADVLSLHVPLHGATRHLVGQAELDRLPAGAILLNSSRGAVLEERALPAALERGLAAAWLDVFEVEPLPVSSPLWKHPRILITPHQADQVRDYPTRFAVRFAQLWGELRGR